MNDEGSRRHCVGAPGASAAERQLIHQGSRRRSCELTKENPPIDSVRFASGFLWLIVSDDPERTFNEAADHIIYQANNLCGVAREGRPHAEPGVFQQRPGHTLLLLDITPGLPPRWAQIHLELFASKVIPAFC
jgi:hypothetical protein